MIMNIPILLYHSVSTVATQLYQPWAIAPERFDEHLAYLRESGYQPLTIGELALSMEQGKAHLLQRPVVVTFDDGLADFLSGAMPILARYHFPATLYVTTGYVGGTSSWMRSEGEHDRPMMTWEELRELEGVEIGGHAHTHPQLDIVPLAKAREEIFLCKEILEQRLARTVQTFAFPHGYYTKKLLDLVRQAGFTSSCIVGHTMATETSPSFALPRIIITSDTTIPILEQYLQGAGLRQVGGFRPILRLGWRMMRWVNHSRDRSITSNHYEKRG
jgi:peptidoglycan/xylan/chitin deacetylase (PgdA/CDA1 family)